MHNDEMDCPAGKYTIQFHLKFERFADEEWHQEEQTSHPFTLETIPVRPLPQELLLTQWFHCDCLATLHHTKLWSRKLWNLLERYFTDMARHGQNMLLTPIFTPPLDTEVGKNRMAVQLLQIELENGHYTFDFKRLEEWISRINSN